jgi:hypothetical protein
MYDTVEAQLVGGVECHSRIKSSGFSVRHHRGSMSRRVRVPLARQEQW